MNQMEIFKNPEFGSIRVIEENGKYLFCGTDVAAALGYSNSRDAIIRHCRYVVKRDAPHPQSPDRKISMTFIPEGDLYRLIVHSKLPSAEQFERWVFDEVLPTIRKHGAYLTKEKLWEVATSPEALMKLCSDLLAEREANISLRKENARQGLDIIPTVHEGAAVQQMEKRGIQTNIGNLNREIKAANRLMKSIRQLIQNLKGWITELGEKRKELLAQKAAEEATLLPNLLMKYMEIRKEERKDWTRAGQNRGTSQDLKAVSEALSYLRQKGLSTVEDLEAFLESSGKSAADYRNQMKPKEARSKVIDGILASRTDCKECKAVYEKYQKIFFKKTKEKFKQEHPEVARYEKATAYLVKHPDDKDSTQKELQEEQETLLSEIAELKVPLTEVQEDLKKLRDIRYWVRKATPGTEESKEPPKKQPIKEVLQDKADEKKAQRTAPAQAKHRQQDMEL